MQKDKYKRIIIVFLLCMGVLCIPMTSTQVQAAKTCSSKIAYPGIIKTKVNMRKKAGIRYKSYGKLKKKQSVTILGVATNGGMKWYKCKAQIGDTVRTGYISAAYIKPDTKTTAVVKQSVSSYVKVRQKAKTSSKVVAKITKGTEVSVLDIVRRSGKYWYKVKVPYKNKRKTGYIQCKFVEVGGTVAPNEQQAQDGYVNDKVTSTLNVRQSPSTNSTILIRIPKGTKVSVLEETGGWYKITVTYKGQTVTGYVVKEYITLGTPPEEDKNIPVSDADFATMLASFPESYKPSIQALHNAYPNWRFVAINTNLDWNTAVANESVVGRNVIQSNYPAGTASLAPFSYLSTEAGAYNWANDTYIVKDGTNWYSANPQVIAYYMDPRNFLNDTDIFQFEALAYDESQSAAVVQSILNNTFMSGNYSVIDSANGQAVSGSYVQAFMDAAKSASANPYFLAARCKQEVGTNGSNATSGTYKGYEGIYNYYNIGASDGGNAVAKGLLWAKGGTKGETTYGRPWTNPYKSIVGGAQYIAKNYINIGQNTLYLQKFNVAPTNAAYLYQHQYMTNVQAPYSEGRSTRTSYNALGILANTMIFYIPVYNNMPATACALPAATGNPNPYLSGISVAEATGSIPAGFSYSTFAYTVFVPANVGAVTVNATTVSRFATVEGAGVYPLNPAGSTDINITGVAQNGARQTYTITIVRQ